jgi:hypothetical protein
MDDSTTETPRKQLRTPEEALEFALAGNAHFTVENPTTGNRFTFRVSTPKRPARNGKTVHFVSVLTGPDNKRHYRYMATIFDGADLRWTRKSKIADGAPSATAFKWAFKRRFDFTDTPAEFWHEGKCGKCARMLTVPESVERGLGPVCAGDRR